MTLYSKDAEKMSAEPDERMTDQGKLLFGAGFVFGVMVTLVLLAVSLITVTRDQTVLGGIGGASILVTVAGGIVFAAIVGAGLFYLAFPAHRAKIPVYPEQFGIEDE